MKKMIFLCGFMGAGKTTIGRLLAEAVQYDFADTDMIIEDECTMTVDDIFKTKGEPFFRELERNVILKLISESGPAVIALGGGSLMDVKNLKDILDAGLMIYLKCDWQVIKDRLLDSNGRPLFHSEDPECTLEYRQVFYSYAGVTVDVSSKTPDQIIEELKPHVKNMRKLFARQVQIE